MDNAPKFLKDFSKATAPDERGQTARRIKEARHAKRGHRTALAQAETQAKTAQIELPQLARQISEREKALERLDKALQELGKQLEETNNTLPGKLDKLFSRAAEAVGAQTRASRIREQIKGLHAQRDELQSEQTRAETFKLLLEGDLRRLDELTSENVREPLDILKNFYRAQGEAWAEAPYNKNDVQRLFTEENLSALDLDGYVTMLRRFPSEMVTHVTRQGVRDHTSPGMHTVGYSEFHHGFEDIMGAGRLRSAIDLGLASQASQTAFEQWLRLDKMQSREQAVEELDLQLSPDAQSLPGSYADRTAVHVATEEVADRFYGAEHGNEIFFAFPSLHIGSQHFFAGQLKEDYGGEHNDQWIFSPDNRQGLNVEAAIAFMPAELPVDPATGSRYALGPDGKPVRDTERFNVLKAFLSDPAASDLFDVYRRAEQGDFRGSEGKSAAIQTAFEAIAAKYHEHGGKMDQAMENIFRNYWLVINALGSTDPEVLAQKTARLLDSVGASFKPAENTVPAKQYWEDYFTAHPEKRPSKIVWYRGDDPTEALNQWRMDNGLTKRQKDYHMGFTERQVKKDEERALAGTDRFRSLALQAIDTYFNRQETHEKFDQAA